MRFASSRLIQLAILAFLETAIAAGAQQLPPIVPPQPMPGTRTGMSDPVPLGFTYAESPLSLKC